MWQKLIYSIFVFLSPKFSNFYVFLFLELFLHEPAMLLRWYGARQLESVTLNIIIFSVGVGPLLPVHCSPLHPLWSQKAMSRLWILVTLGGTRLLLDEMGACKAVLKAVQWTSVCEGNLLINLPHNLITIVPDCQSVCRCEHLMATVGYVFPNGR
jgi:hypothetical protein